MKLSQQDIDLFYQLYSALLLFVNQHNPVVAIETAEQLMGLPIQDRLDIRESLFKNIEIIDEFVNTNPDNLSEQELDIILSWKSFVKSEFYLLRQLKKHAIFLSIGNTSKAYGVTAIFDLFETMIPFMPIIVDTVLLPFKGIIIYDGLMASRNIHFGGGIKKSINDQYNTVKAKYGIVTTLPYDTESVKTTSDVDLLKYYLRSASNQDRHWDDVQKLIRKSEENKVTYYQEIGKYFAKKIGKRLRELDVNSGWFGLLENMVVGSGKTKQEALSNIQGIVSKDKMRHVYLFQLRMKK